MDVKKESVARINTLESEVEKLQQIKNRNFLICSGPVVEEHILQEGPTNLKRTFQNYLNQNIGKFNEHEIETVTIFGKSRKILKVKCTSSAVRNKILSAARRKKVPDVYFNELLTHQKNRLYFKLRELKRAHPDKISSTYSRNGNIYYKLVNVEGFKSINSESEVSNLSNRLRESV